MTRNHFYYNPLSSIQFFLSAFCSNKVLNINNLINCWKENIIRELTFNASIFKPQSTVGLSARASTWTNACVNCGNIGKRIFFAMPYNKNNTIEHRLSGHFDYPDFSPWSPFFSLILIQISSFSYFVAFSLHTKCNVLKQKNLNVWFH